MTQPIVHRDLFSVLSLELKQDPKFLRDALFRDPSYLSVLMPRVEGLPWSDLDFVLGEAITLSDEGAPLLAKGTSLTPAYIRALLGRQLQNRDRIIGPVALVPSEATLGHYRRKVSGYFESIVEKLRTAVGERGAIVQKVLDTTKELTCVKESFDEIIEGILTSSDSVSTILSVVANRGNDSLAERSTSASLVSMATLALRDTFKDGQTRKAELKRVGAAALFQDVSLMLDHSLCEVEHPAKSADIARQLGVEEDAVAAILWHHRTTSDRGEPILAEETLLPVHARVLVAANVFLDMVAGQARVSGFEALKAMSFMAANGYLDRRSVGIIARLCLPRVKSFIIEKASKIGELCRAAGSRPVAWPVTGDKVPAVFICQADECPHASKQVNRLARDIPFFLEGVEVAMVRKGDYATCGFLTPKLKELYDFIQGKAQAASPG